MKSFTVKEMEQMAADLTIKTPMTLDKIHNGALQMMVKRAKLLAIKEEAETDLANNGNVVSIDKNKKGGK